MSSHSITENLIRLQEAKEDIADAIVEMGGTASPTDGLEDMPNNIRTIPSGTQVIEGTVRISNPSGNMRIAYQKCFQIATVVFAAFRIEANQKNKTIYIEGLDLPTTTLKTDGMKQENGGTYYNYASPAYGLVITNGSASIRPITFVDNTKVSIMSNPNSLDATTVYLIAFEVEPASS